MNKQAEIIAALGVNAALNTPEALLVESTVRIAFIKERMKAAQTTALVLGISGGVDSLVAGKLCQIAAEELRQEGYPAEFIAVRLPFRVQADEDAAQRALAFIKPDKTTTVNIADAVEGLMGSLSISSACHDPAKVDFAKGNVKARTRMMAQYAIANFTNGLVVGTDHGAEAVMGFFTKFGDGACDIAPLSGMIKTQVREMALVLGAERDMAYKVPTADLEELDPGKRDETAYGCSYEEIDAFLLGQQLEPRVEALIIAQYDKTAHKRVLPYSPV
jgi:NAD+ synthase